MQGPRGVAGPRFPALAGDSTCKRDTSAFFRRFRGRSPPAPPPLKLSFWFAPRRWGVAEGRADHQDPPLRKGHFWFERMMGVAEGVGQSPGPVLGRRSTVVGVA